MTAGVEVRILVRRILDHLIKGRGGGCTASGHGVRSAHGVLGAMGWRCDLSLGGDRGIRREVFWKYRDVRVDGEHRRRWRDCGQVEVLVVGVVELWHGRRLAGPH